MLKTLNYCQCNAAEVYKSSYRGGHHGLNWGSIINKSHGEAF